MPQVIWTNFASAEFKRIFLYFRMVAGDTVATKFSKSILRDTSKLLKNPQMGMMEENLKSIGLEHRFIITGNYKIIYFLKKITFTL